MLLGSWRALFSDNLGSVWDSSQVPLLGWSPDSEISPKQLFLLLAQLPAPIVHKESTVRPGATTSPRTLNTPAKIPQDYAGEILTLGYPPCQCPDRTSCCGHNIRTKGTSFLSQNGRAWAGLWIWMDLASLVAPLRPKIKIIPVGWLEHLSRTLPQAQFYHQSPLPSLPPGSWLHP